MTAETLDTPVVASPTASPPHPLREFWGYFSANHGAVAGLAVIVVVVLVAILADVIAPHSPYLTDTTVALKPPFWQEGGLLTYPLGTDPIGRDILSRLIYGSRLSLMIGIAVVSISIVLGTVLGLVAGFVRGITEIFIMRLMDIILTLPSLLLAIVIVAVLGPGLMNSMLAVALVILPHYVRLARAAVITETSKDYVTAARVSGAGTDPADVQGGAAQLHRAADRAGIPGHFHRDPRCRRPGISRPRRPAALSRMGHHAGGCPRICAARLVGRDFPGSRHPDHGAGLQPAG